MYNYVNPVSGEVLAIALFVVAVVVVIAGGGIMLFLIFRWINGKLVSHLLGVRNVTSIR